MYCLHIPGISGYDTTRLGEPYFIAFTFVVPTAMCYHLSWVHSPSSSSCTATLDVMGIPENSFRVPLLFVTLSWHIYNVLWMSSLQS